MATVETPLAGDYKYGFSVPENYQYKARPGLSAQLVREISAMKGEPQWMLEFRLRALDAFLNKPMPNWGADLSSIDFDEIYYYIRATEKTGPSW